MVLLEDELLTDNVDDDELWCGLEEDEVDEEKDEVDG